MPIGALGSARLHEWSDRTSPHPKDQTSPDLGQWGRQLLGLLNGRQVFGRVLLLYLTARVRGSSEGMRRGSLVEPPKLLILVIPVS